MRFFASVMLLFGSFLLGAACGSGSTDRLGPTNSGQDATATNAQDTAATNGQDTAATDGQDATAANTQDTAATDSPASTQGPATEAGSVAGPLASSPLTRATADLSDTEKSALATSLSGFAFALLQELRGDPSLNSNFAFSPTSISLALGMAYAGALGNTAAQMKDSMQVATSGDVYFRSLNWLDQQLEARADAALKQDQSRFTSSGVGGMGSPPDPADYRLHVVNACWGERTMTFEQPYLDTLATDFGSGIHLADFKNQPEVERLTINAWVSDETLKRINDLISPGEIDSATRAVLVNAIHLKLPWDQPFLATGTNTGTFTKADGSAVSVPFMNKGGQLSYSEDDTTQAVAIPLSGRAVSFIVFLPKPTSSLSHFEDSLSQAHAQALHASMSAQTVSLSLPKFVFTTQSVRLNTALIALGMTDAFSARDADFTGITKEKPLFIGAVIHKAMVGVDEHGIEAAAATVVRMTGTGMPTEVKQVNVNRPFFFGIYDGPTSTWLFLGHVTDPSS